MMGYSCPFPKPFTLAVALCFIVLGSLLGANMDYSSIEKAIAEHNLALAKQVLDSHLQAEPRDARAHMLLGIVLDEQNQPEQAEKEIKEALRIQPNLAAAHVNLGKHYARQGDLAAAVRELDTAVHLDPDNATAHENLGAVLLARGDRAQAVGQLQAAVALAPRQPSVLMTLLKAQLASREFAQARATVSRIADLAPPTVDPYAALGTLQAEAGDWSGAIQSFEKALAREPKSPDLHYNLALAQQKSGNLEGAREILETMQRENDRGEIENLLGQVYEDERQYVKAAQALQRAIKLEPANESYRFDFALELLKHRSYDVAIAVSEQAISDFPSSMRLRLIQGVSYFGRGLYDDSVGTFFEAARRFPDEELPLFCLAQAARVTGDKTEEVQSLVSAYSKRHPTQPWPLYFLGQLASQMGEATGHRADLEHAGVLLRKSVALDSNYAEAHFELGNVYSRLSQWRDAAEEYRKAIKLKQSMPEAHYRLATVYRHLGNSASARSELQAHQRLTQAESARSQRDQDVQVFLFKLARQD